MDRISDKLRWQAIHHADAIKDVKCKDRIILEKVISELYTILVANKKGQQWQVDALVSDCVNNLQDHIDTVL